MKNLLKDNEFEKRFIYIERDLIQENKFSIAKSELGKIIHDAKIKNLSEVLDRARELLRSCNSKKRKFSKKVDQKYFLNDDKKFLKIKKMKISEDKKDEINQENLIDYVNNYDKVSTSQIAEHFFPAPLPYRNYFLSMGRASFHSEIFYQTEKIVESAIETITINLKKLVEQNKLQGKIEQNPHAFESFFINEIKMEEKKKGKESRINKIAQKRKEEEEKLEKMIKKRDPWEEINSTEFWERECKLRDKEYNKWKKEVEKYDMINIFQQVEGLDDLVQFIKKREVLVQELFSLYWREGERYAELIIYFFSSYFEINPYELDFQLIPYLLDSKKRLVSIFKDANIKKNPMKVTLEWGELKLTHNRDIKNLFKKFEKFSYDSMKKEYLTTISKNVKEFIFNVSVKDLYDLLLNFDKVIPLKGSDQLTEDSNEYEYGIKMYLGLLNFKVIDKEGNIKIIYQYDFSKSIIKEKGKLFLNFIDLGSGRVKLKMKNEIFESSGEIKYLNWIGTNFESWINQNIGKMVAKQVQTIFYEKSFEDLTMGNYRILQAKLNAIGKDIDKLKVKYFEVKAPLTLNSFECSECGATLNITSKDEKFIICDHCSTPFLMEWQKG